MKEIETVKKNDRLKNWMEMIQQRSESGLSIVQWCKENDVNIKTYYYRLGKVRNAMCEQLESHDIVPIKTEKKEVTSSALIKISIENAEISVPNEFNTDTLKRIFEALK